MSAPLRSTMSASACGFDRSDRAAPGVRPGRAPVPGRTHADAHAHAPDSSLNYPGFGRSKTHDYTGVVRGEVDVNDAVTVHGGFGHRKHHMDVVAGNPVLLNAAAISLRYPHRSSSKSTSTPVKRGSTCVSTRARSSTGCRSVQRRSIRIGTSSSFFPVSRRRAVPISSIRSTRICRTRQGFLCP